MNTKGSARDIIVFGVVMFSVALMMFIANFALNTTIDGLLANPTINSSGNETISALQSTQDVVNKFDYVVAGVFIALVLGVLITGWFIGGYPIFMAIYFLFNVVAVIISGILSSFWNSFSLASVFGSTFSNFPITNQIMANLQLYVAIVGIIGIVVMFAKPYFQGDTA